LQKRVEKALHDFGELKGWAPRHRRLGKAQGSACCGVRPVHAGGVAKEHSYDPNF